MRTDPARKATETSTGRTATLLMIYETITNLTQGLDGYSLDACPKVLNFS